MVWSFTYISKTIVPYRMWQDKVGDRDQSYIMCWGNSNEISSLRGVRGKRNVTDRETRQPEFRFYIGLDSNYWKFQYDTIVSEPSPSRYSYRVSYAPLKSISSKQMMYSLRSVATEWAVCAPSTYAMWPFSQFLVSKRCASFNQNPLEWVNNAIRLI